MRDQPGQFADLFVGRERKDEPRRADGFEFDHLGDLDLADLPLHRKRFLSYRAQSTMTVPSLSPSSTARCACAVSFSANCPAILCRRGPAASHFVMSACAAACKGAGSAGSTSERSAMQRAINSRTGTTGLRLPLVA